ncbi:MAG TPA: hypothetical protein DHU56_13820 [Marinobacter sp.]|jgi:hypothetical protein|nr:hypothetical protein [Marinobacter sp.]
MIIRLFLVLLALNLLTLVVRAEAADLYGEPEETVRAEDVYELPEQQISGEYDSDQPGEALTAIGSRLLTLGFMRKRYEGKHYGSDPAYADHGVALLEDGGACLNLRWNF